MTVAFPTRPGDHSMTLMASLAARKGLSLEGKTLGLVGFTTGCLGFANRALHGFGMKLMAWVETPEQAEALREMGCEICEDMDEVLRGADVISLHARPKDKRPLIGGIELGKMKPDALLINTGAPALVDQMALSHALWFETIGGASMTGPGVISDLQDCDDIIVMPPPMTSVRHAHLQNGIWP